MAKKKAVKKSGKKAAPVAKKKRKQAKKAAIKQTELPLRERSENTHPFKNKPKYK